MKKYYVITACICLLFCISCVSAPDQSKIDESCEALQSEIVPSVPEIASVNLLVEPPMVIPESSNAGDAHEETAKNEKKDPKITLIVETSSAISTDGTSSTSAGFYFEYQTGNFAFGIEGPIPTEYPGSR